MKLTNLFLVLLAASLFSLTGCNKKAVKPEEKVGTVTIDMQKVYDLASGTSPDVQQTAAKLQSEIRYRQWEQALADLDRIVNDPSLSAKQKQEAQDLIGQAKQLATQPPAQ